MNADKIYHMVVGGLVYLVGTLHSPLIGLCLVLVAKFSTRPTGKFRV